MGDDAIARNSAPWLGSHPKEEAMAYVDGFVIPVPKNKVAAYLKMARWGARLWMKHGAVDYKECIGEALASKCGLPFPKVIRAKPNETVFFSFIVYRSKAHRNAVNKRVMSDPSMQEPSKDMPFDVKRMLYGGFKILVDAKG